MSFHAFNSSFATEFGNVQIVLVEFILNGTWGERVVLTGRGRGHWLHLRVWGGCGHTCVDVVINELMCGCGLFISVFDVDVTVCPLRLCICDICQSRLGHSGSEGAARTEDSSRGEQLVTIPGSLS